ncbi:MAG TPA: cupin domain-containing protein [Gemmatimonadales bacterium]|nr:cupin domain-containing protein [Gemmatimonadales bacterium]
MRLSIRTIPAAATLILLAACAPSAEDTGEAIRTATADVTTGVPDSWRTGLSWTDLVIPGVPAGARMAVVQGDPSATGEFVMRLDFPDGFTFPPHTHPTDEHVTVVEGTLRIGMGAQVDPLATQVIETGGVITAPAAMVHYAIAEGRTVVQIHGMGPFAVELAEADVAAR